MVIRPCKETPHQSPPHTAWPKAICFNYNHSWRWTWVLTRSTIMFKYQTKKKVCLSWIKLQGFRKQNIFTPRFCIGLQLVTQHNAKRFQHHFLKSDFFYDHFVFVQIFIWLTTILTQLPLKSLRDTFKQALKGFLCIFGQFLSASALFKWMKPTGRSAVEKLNYQTL